MTTKFGAIDCSQIDCIIAAAPLPSSASAAEIQANTVTVPITMAGAEPPAEQPPAEEPPAEEPPAEAPADTTTEAGGDLPQTGAGDSLPVLVLAGGALLLTGLGVVLLVPMHRRQGGLS